MNENLVKFRKKWPRIKVIALTKDEKEALPGFFDQFRTITDQFAILDSGSTDGTIEWARSNGVQVASHAFERFDSQRNAAIDAFGKSADWIIMLDPDERLDKHTIDHIYDLVRTEEFDIYLTHIFSKHPDGSEREWIGKPFLWRNNPGIRWALPVHEKLIGSMRQAWIKNGRIDHVIALHKPERRAQSEAFYAKLAGLPRQNVSKWPIIDYEHPMHKGLKQIAIGPLVSVVMPTYNRQALRIKAEESIRRQDYFPYEVIVVGDGLGTIGGIVGYQGEGDKFSYVTLPKNHGAGGAEPRNYGIMLASGSLIAYCDDDNTLREDHISSLVDAVEGGAEYAISSMNTLGKDLIFDFPALGKFDTSCLLHKKSLITKYGWWKSREECGSYAHDWLFVKPWVDAGEKCVATKKATLIYNAESSGQLEFLKKLVEA
jgi:glycosyltransferase involved in cell wall biosynthesis